MAPTCYPESDDVLQRRLGLLEQQRLLPLATRTAKPLLIADLSLNFNDKFMTILNKVALA
jgi:hypothetical protein